MPTSTSSSAAAFVQQKINFLKTIIHRRSHENANSMFFQFARRELHDGPYVTLSSMLIGRNDSVRLVPACSSVEIHLSTLRAAKEFSPSKMKKLLKEGELVDVCVVFEQLGDRMAKYKIYKELRVSSDCTISVPDVTHRTISLCTQGKEHDFYYVVWCRKSNAPPGIFLPVIPSAWNLGRSQDWSGSLRYYAFDVRDAELIGVLHNPPQAFATRAQQQQTTVGTMANMAVTSRLAKRILFPCSCVTSYHHRSKFAPSRVDVVRLMLGEHPSQPNWPFIVPVTELKQVMIDLILQLDVEAIQYLAPKLPKDQCDRDFIRVACLGMPGYHSVCDAGRDGENPNIHLVYNTIIPLLFEYFGDELRASISDIWLYQLFDSLENMSVQRCTRDTKSCIVQCLILYLQSDFPVLDIFATATSKGRFEEFQDFMFDHAGSMAHDP